MVLFPVTVSVLGEIALKGRSGIIDSLSRRDVDCSNFFGERFFVGNGFCFTGGDSGGGLGTWSPPSMTMSCGVVGCLERIASALGNNFAWVYSRFGSFRLTRCQLKNLGSCLSQSCRSPGDNGPVFSSLRKAACDLVSFTPSLLVGIW